MFIGHYALGFGAKRYAPEVSLGALFLACQFADLLWPTLVLLGVEFVRIEPGATAVTPLDFIYYPYSHSLTAMLAWAAVVTFAYSSLRASVRWPSLAVVASLVVSHWFLDLVVHRPDMPLTVYGTLYLGLGLWNSLPGTVLLELLLLALGVRLYTRATVARDRQGTAGLWALVLLLLAIYAAVLFGPPPFDVRAVAWTGQAMWLLVGLGYWVDRHRQPRASPVVAAAAPSTA
jgi:hypothetical protein